MLKSFRKLFRPAAPPPPGARLPQGQRVYAIGDIHGCLAQFEALIAALDADDDARGQADTTMILLGDLVDRGPDSAGVIARARDWQARRKVRILAGNHEEMLLDALEKEEVLRHFLRYGGRETALSYPIAPEAYQAADLAETRALMRAAIPAADLDFIRGFEDAIQIGDYLFVHAGIDPDRPLDEQLTRDLRWIREPFLSRPGDFGALVVVHGHTIFDEVDLAPHRISVDTGAYKSGKLTALALEGGARWLIEARLGEDGAVTVSNRSIA